VYSLDVELNSDSEGKTEQNGCLLGTMAGENIGDSELLRYKTGTMQKFIQQQLRDTDLYHMEGKENPAAILASVAFVLQLQLLKASL